MNPYLKITALITGIIFIILGIVGLFVPILQGILFIVIGVYILSLTSERFRTWFDRHIARFPKVKHHYDRHRTKVDKIFKKRGGE